MIRDKVQKDLERLAGTPVFTRLIADPETGEELLWFLLQGEDAMLLDSLDAIIADYWIHLPLEFRLGAGLDVELKGTQ